MKHLSPPLLAAALLAFPLTDTLHAQLPGGAWELRLDFHGGAIYEDLGYSVAGLGDADGDGIDDLAVGLPLSGVVPERVHVYSGADGALIRSFTGPYPSSEYASTVCGPGDLDGDGLGDVVVAAPIPGLVVAYSPATGATLWFVSGSSSFGESMAVAPDYSGDGVADLLVGHPGGGANGRGAVDVLSGVDGSLVLRRFGVATQDFVGQAVAMAGDLDQDGVDDFMATTYGTGFYGYGELWVFSGADGTPLRMIPQLLTKLPMSLLDGGDQDGDGYPEILVGEPRRGPGGQLSIYSGAPSSPLLGSIQGWLTQQELGASLVRIDDRDGDGVGEIALASSKGLVQIISGQGLGLLQTLPSVTYSPDFGVAMDAVGDLDGDGLVELAVGDPHSSHSFYYAGSVWVFGMDSRLTFSADSLSLSGSPAVQAAIDFPPSEAGQPYALLASLAGAGNSMLGGLAVPLVVDPLTLRMVGGWQPPGLVGGSGTLDAAGDATATLTGSAAITHLLGSTLALAAVSFDAGPPASGRLASTVRFLEVLP